MGSFAVQIMEPIHEGDRDLLLVYCPGALKASEKYFPLMHAIQAQLSLRLWIVVLHNTDQEVLSTSKIDVSLTGVFARLKQSGFRSGSIDIENVFLAGHRFIPRHTSRFRFSLGCKRETVIVHTIDSTPQVSNG